ncbi:MAG: hypothetical protein K2Q34_06350 [Alphaproteobacteria bacterium]|nr:hypothetical protein [Alphaproteobacteria bacterium]
MKKSLHKVLFLTVATTALSTIPTYAGDDPLASGAPRSTVTNTVVPASSVPVDPSVPVAPKKTVKVVSTGCGGCLAGVGAWFSRTFTRQNLQTAGHVVDEVASLAQVGLAATGDKRLTDIATGIRTGVKVAHTVTDDLSGPDGVSVAGVLKAVNDGADGAVMITGQVAPGKGSQVSNVVSIIKASDDAASTLFGPDGKPTASSVLSAGGKIASIVANQTGDKDAEITAAVLSRMGGAVQAQQGVTTAISNANPLPETTA